MHPDSIKGNAGASAGGQKRPARGRFKPAADGRDISEKDNHPRSEQGP